MTVYGPRTNISFEPSNCHLNFIITMYMQFEIFNEHELNIEKRSQSYFWSHYLMSVDLQLRDMNHVSLIELRLQE